MNNISTTDLRTKTASLVETLTRGGSVNLVHRSRTIGEIKPKNTAYKVMNGKKLLDRVNRLSLTKLEEKDINTAYREVMIKKHGKDLF